MVEEGCLCVQRAELPAMLWALVSPIWMCDHAITLEATKKTSFGEDNCKFGLVRVNFSRKILSR